MFGLLKDIFSWGRFKKMMGDERGFLQALLPFVGPALSIGQSLFARGKKAQATGGTSPAAALPDYKKFASEYEKPTAKQLYETYSTRAKEGIGYGPEELAQMRAEAIEQAAGAGSEYERRAMAGRQLTGGMSTAGRNRIREKSLGATLGMRSQGLRDIAIQDALSRRQEKAAGATGLQNFLGGERTQQQRAYDAAVGKAGAQTTDWERQQKEATEVAEANRQRKAAFGGSLFNIGSSLLSRFIK